MRQLGRRSCSVPIGTSVIQHQEALNTNAIVPYPPHYTFMPEPLALSFNQEWLTKVSKLNFNF